MVGNDWVEAYARAVPVGPSDWRSWQGAAIDFALTRSIADTAALLDSLQTLQPVAVFQTPLERSGFFAQLDQPVHPGSLALRPNHQWGRLSVPKRFKRFKMR
ncbi:hypothetical protein L3X07_12800 [Levilactobacillus brevis]|nr:hypothetical protein [Levilactobacillus brevis]